MKGQDLWYLENLDMKNIMCPKKLAGSHDEQSHKEIEKGSFIYLVNDDSDKIFFIVSGRVKIGKYGEGGKEITKCVLGPGEVFGELAAVSETKRRDFAQAMEPTILCGLQKDEMKGLLKDRNSFSLFIMNLLGSRVLEVEKRLESMVFKDSRSRIVEFIYDLGVQKGKRVGYEQVVRKFLTHQEIANLTATSRQTVTTTLNELRTKNLLTFNRKRLLIRDMEKLKEEIQ